MVRSLCPLTKLARACPPEAPRCCCSQGEARWPGSPPPRVHEGLSMILQPHPALVSRDFPPLKQLVLDHWIFINLVFTCIKPWKRLRGAVAASGWIFLHAVMAADDLTGSLKITEEASSSASSVFLLLPSRSSVSLCSLSPWRRASPES